MTCQSLDCIGAVTLHFCRKLSLPHLETYVEEDISHTSLSEVSLQHENNILTRGINVDLLKVIRELDFKSYDSHKIAHKAIQFLIVLICSLNF